MKLSLRWYIKIHVIYTVFSIFHRFTISLFFQILWLPATARIFKSSQWFNYGQPKCSSHFRARQDTRWPTKYTVPSLWYQHTNPTNNWITGQENHYKNLHLLRDGRHWTTTPSLITVCAYHHDSNLCDSLVRWGYVPLWPDSMQHFQTYHCSSHYCYSWHYSQIWVYLCQWIVVYGIKCTCYKVYIGETGRPLEDRFQDHQHSTQLPVTWTSPLATTIHSLVIARLNVHGLQFYLNFSKSTCTCMLVLGLILTYMWHCICFFQSL